jgi:hypothetical protein
VSALDEARAALHAFSVHPQFTDALEAFEAAVRANERGATEAHPPRHRWYVETLDGLADQWAPGMRLTDQQQAATRLRDLNQHHPRWRDGTAVQRRLVRETTSYTVEAQP